MMVKTANNHKFQQKHAKKLFDILNWLFLSRYNSLLLILKIYIDECFIIYMVTKEEVEKYLDQVPQVPMKRYGAGPLLVERFEISAKEADDFVGAWMLQNN